MIAPKRGPLPGAGLSIPKIRPIERYLADVVHDAPQFPDDSDFFASQVVDPPEPFGVSNIVEDGFDRSHAVAVSFAGFRGINLGSHCLAMGPG